MTRERSLAKPEETGDDKTKPGMIIWLGKEQNDANKDPKQ